MASLRDDVGAVGGYLPRVATRMLATKVMAASNRGAKEAEGGPSRIMTGRQPVSREWATCKAPFRPEPSMQAAMGGNHLGRLASDAERRGVGRADCAAARSALPLARAADSW